MSLNKFVDFIDLRRQYSDGVNIIEYLTHKYSDILSREDIISISYSLQSGSYTKQYSKKRHTIEYISSVFGDIINNDFTESRSILDCGCGEYSTTIDIFSKLLFVDNFYVFDISLSRLLAGSSFCNNLVTEANISNIDCSSIKASVSRLDQIPFNDNSVDILITSHVIEPNRGSEKKIIKELLRVAKHGVILHEPDYENSSKQQKERMDRHGYAVNIRGHIQDLGYNFDVINIDKHYNPNNTASFTIIKKESNNTCDEIVYVDPISKSKLVEKNNFLFSEKRGVLFPIYNRIPILVESQSILTPWLINKV